MYDLSTIQALLFFRSRASMQLEPARSLVIYLYNLVSRANAGWGGVLEVQMEI